MRLNHNFNSLDEISFDQAIFSDKVYRKIRNLDESYYICELNFKNKNFVWEKVTNFRLPQGYECVSFNNLVYVKENNSHITIYNIEGNYSTKLMIYTGNNTLIWDILNIPFDINNLNTYSLLTIPTHVNLIDECHDDPYDIIDEFEPLHGWSNLLERSSDTEENPEEKIILDNDLENDLEMNDNFVYPDVDDEDHPLEGCFVNEVSNHSQVEEYRLDPYDGRWYSYYDFIDYYGGENEWDFMEPKKFLMREEYYKFTNTFCHLSDKKFKFLFREFKKTY